MDVTHYYFELVLPDSNSPSGLSTVYRGQLENVIAIPETFRSNNLGNGLLDDLTVVPASNLIPARTLIVPRRNSGPLLAFGPGLGLSIQYTGFSGTREPDAILGWDSADNLDAFIEASKFIGVGSFNAAYSDVSGNIAYFTVGEMPIREDLQAGAVAGAPPFFVRSGWGGDKGLPVQDPLLGQVLRCEIPALAAVPHLLHPGAVW